MIKEGEVKVECLLDKCMQKQNITLSLPKELLNKIKHIAIDRNSSVSSLLANTLQEIVDQEDSYNKSMKLHIEMLQSGRDLSTSGKIQWKREQLHER